MNDAWKEDSGKARLELLPPRALFAVARAMASGAARYGDRNWEAGLHWSRLFGAVMRHCWAWWRGENVDPDSGLSHLAHAAASLLMLLEQEERGRGADDRPD